MAENKEEIDKSEWSPQDHRSYELTGFIPGKREDRECVSCGQKGHYYYECGGDFFKMVDALVEGLKSINKK